MECFYVWTISLLKATCCSKTRIQGGKIKLHSKFALRHKDWTSGSLHSLKSNSRTYILKYQLFWPIRTYLDSQTSLSQQRERRLKQGRRRLLHYEFIPGRLAWKVCINIPGIKLVWTVWTFGEKIEIMSGAVVLHITSFHVTSTKRAKECIKTWKTKRAGRAELSGSLSNGNGSKNVTNLHI